MFNSRFPKSHVMFLQ